MPRRPRHDLPTTPFDVEADDMSHQFWGTSKGWVSSEQPIVRRRGGAGPGSQRADRPARPTNAARAADDTTGSLRVIREGFAAFRPQTSSHATGEITRQRRHGEARDAVSPSVPTAPRHATHRHEATLAELAAGHADVDGRREIEAEYDVPLTPVQPLAERLGLGAVDPLLLRAGAFLLALILLVPVMLSLRPDRDDSFPGDLVEAPPQVAAGAAPVPADNAPAGSAVTASPTVEQPAAEQSAVEQSATSASTAPSASTAAATAVDAPAGGSVAAAAEAPADAVPATTADEPNASAAERDAAAEVDVRAERVVPACPQTYTAAAGDSWYRIADAAGVAPQDLLAQNNATTDTVILPGDDICLPDGAAMPTPPTTVTPSTTTEPAPTTTDAPATTAPATTVAPVADLSPSEVQELIRQTWPDDEVETALAVARRESNFVATADNGWCCVGVFQIYWSVHRSWLDDFGITERSDLFDARKNIAAAYAMWQRSGWEPWGG